MSNVTRRHFAGLAALSYSRILGANDRVRMGFIGVGNRGDKVHEAFLEWGDNQTVAVCDLRDDYMDLAVKKSRGTPKRHKDYRKVLDDKDVDAVMIATPITGTPSCASTLATPARTSTWKSRSPSPSSRGARWWR